MTNDTANDDRLGKSDWIDQGLRTLAGGGAGALKVGAMAEKLNVSRGSFYWHFADIAAFKSALLRSWRERMTDRVIRDVAGKDGPDRLAYLLKRAFAARPRLDRAIRTWATEDKSVAVIVAAVDAERIAYIAKLLVAAGVARKRALARATFLYWAYLGQAIVMDPRHAAIPAPALDDIGALFET
ncbi:TetR/AcrR family transcriptional regulator [Reyranella massiliensis]|uniref:TetR/AcrR family transcriptional regulator n=1 Tax=Reyranella massiliensis TaxID=445220 RepID=UPI0005BBADF6|nr:TetR/AcrR family transcriptional regulator [Reyranella massiliensis]